MKVINIHYNVKQFHSAIKTCLVFIFIIVDIGKALGMENNKSSLYIHQSQLYNISLNAETIDNELFIDLPISVLNKPFLWIRYDNDTFGHKYKHITFTKQKDFVLLELPPIQSQSGIIIPNEGAVNKSKIIGRFPIIRNGNYSTLLRINITNLLFDPIFWHNTNTRVLKQNSFVDDINIFKDELVIQTTQTVIKDGKISASQIDFGFYHLPNPMYARLFDHRMGFFTEDHTSQINHNTDSSIGSIMRWRLEKKEPYKELSDPIEPITFVLSPKIPKKWRSYVKAGILEWTPAFEAAGFKNALIIKEVSDNSTIENTIHTSVIRWHTGENIRGQEDRSGSTVSKIVDLRSGEILKADILIRTSLQHLSDKYFIRCAPMDIRTQQYPFPDDLMGELIQSLIAHEAGHAFGIKDANYGEFTYPLEMIRNEDWLRKMGHTASIMSYTRHNNIAQPKDSVFVRSLIQKVGPADIYNIKWGYTVVPGTSEKERKFLENLIRQQDTTPWYRYNISKFEIRGPDATNEVVDNADPIESTILALENMKRVINLLPKINKDKRDNEHAQRLYEKTLALWFDQMRQVMSLVGGYTIQYKSGGQQGNVFTPIPKIKQIQAMDFLLKHAFTTPDWLSFPEIVERTGYTINNDKLSNLQTRLLIELLEAYRMNRLEYMQQQDIYKGLQFELLLKLQNGLFIELNKRNENITFRKLEIQAVYVDMLLSIIKKDSLNSKFTKASSHYNQVSKSNCMNLLSMLRKSIEEGLKHINTPMVHGHFSLLVQRINEKLD